MAIIKLLHNPGAGDGEHDKEELVKLLEDEGYDCRYSSTKEKGWDEIEPDTEMIVLAGGDGTVRKVAKKMLPRKLIDKQLPIGLLPAGTANNIAKTLGIPPEREKAIKIWENNNLHPFDAGKICDKDDVGFFIESFGLGLFPQVMREMRNHKEEQGQDPDKRIQKALEVFAELLESYEAPMMYITADDNDYSGRYYMAEVMNTGSIGPRMVLNPAGDPGDGCFELVLLPESDKKQLAAYLQKRIEGEEVQLKCKTIQAGKITLRSKEIYYHADDEVMKIKDESTINIEMLKGVLEFYVK